MHASEARALGELGGQLAAGVAGWAEGLHQAAVSRVVPGPGGVGGRARTVHDAVVGRTYGAARALGGVVGAAFGAVLAPLASGSPLSGSPTGGQVVSTLNAVVGDRLHAQGSPLALPMALRGDGEDIAPARADLDTAFPDATGRLVLFVHGLAETDLAWMGRDGDGRPWSYAHALQPRGWTGAAVRYNTGRHIADSGESLGSLLEAVVAAWPAPVTDLALVGHSMGGLVIRAACASSVAAGHVWPALVRCCVYLGSPHHGAVLEQGADVVGRVLGDIAQAGPLATLLRLRSAGIQDLRHGRFTTDDDAEGHHSDAGVALLPTARHHLVAAYLGTSENNPVAAVLGDMVVRSDSALGLGERGGEALDLAERTVLPGTHHFALLKDPRVAEALVGWLS